MDTLGAFALAVLVVTGLAAGFIAGKIAGRNMALYMIVGVLASVATPFVLAALGVGVLALGGIALLVVAAAMGAVVVLALVRALQGRKK